MFREFLHMAVTFASVKLESAKVNWFIPASQVMVLTQVTNVAEQLAAQNIKIEIANKEGLICWQIHIIAYVLSGCDLIVMPIERAQTLVMHSFGKYVGERSILLHS